MRGPKSPIQVLESPGEKMGNTNNICYPSPAKLVVFGKEKVTGPSLLGESTLGESALIWPLQVYLCPNPWSDV